MNNELIFLRNNKFTVVELINFIKKYNTDISGLRKLFFDFNDHLIYLEHSYNYISIKTNIYYSTVEYLHLVRLFLEDVFELLSQYQDFYLAQVNKFTLLLRENNIKYKELTYDILLYNDYIEELQLFIDVYNNHIITIENTINLLEIIK